MTQNKTNEKYFPYSLSSRSVNRPICGNSLNCSRQISPEHSILIIATWSCLTNRGRVFDFSPVFLSTKHIRACNREREKNKPLNWRCQFVNKEETNVTYIDGDFFSSTMNMHHCWISSTYDRFMFQNHHLRIEFLSGFDWLRSITQNETRRDIFFFDSLWRKVKKNSINKSLPLTLSVLLLSVTHF